MPAGTNGNGSSNGNGNGNGTHAAPPRVEAAVWEEAASIADLLSRNREELSNLLVGLGGGYVPPEAGGDLLRDGPGVLPTGRNIHALDPYRMPGPAATERGAAAAAAILEAHRAANGGAWPETLAVNLWGLDAIKTKGESVGMVLYLVGGGREGEGGGSSSWLRVGVFFGVPAWLSATC